MRTAVFPPKRETEERAGANGSQQKGPRNRYCDECNRHDSRGNESAGRFPDTVRSLSKIPSGTRRSGFGVRTMALASVLGDHSTVCRREWGVKAF